ncbi:MAG: electron transporter [Desulfuromonadales bacterium GWD2_61_12]|nr:MAG: electron transporter [Desulfuromonadales bacterium GWC2_61_20]OGR35936.1 MAG: electron transporter [Desulfuromonadales bacterium GWD2_61_12]
MEMTREIYWNVGHGVIVPMYLLVAAALAVLFWGMWRRHQVWRRGQRLVVRNDDLAGRLRRALIEVLSQRQLLRVHGAGDMHALFFWGFVLLTIGTTLVFLQADFTDPFFAWRFLTGPFYLGFSLVLDLAGLAAILTLLGLAWRRFVLRPEGLITGRDDVIMHTLLLIILVSGFVVEGLRLAVTELGTPLAPWSPVGWAIATLFAGGEPESLRTLHKTVWWGHLGLVAAFFVAVPFTRLRHLLTTSSNYIFVDQAPKGTIATPDLEAEGVESFGVGTIAEASWKDLLDGDACTLCKRCQDRCPAWATSKPLSPMQVINQVQAVAFTAPEANLVDTVSRDVLWACTTCRACQEICPAAIEHVNQIIEMRRHLALMAGEFPGPEVAAAMNHTEINGNPLGSAFAGRGDWAAELGVKSLADDSEVDLLYFVGCYASFDPRNIKVAKSFIRLCQAAGLKVGILGKEEKCCGEPARKLGNEYLYQSVAAENIAKIQKYGIKRIVATCPHCFNTLGRDYRDLGLELPVEHHTTFLAELLQAGKLPLKAAAFTCTYHDSCYLGRYADIYAAPRALIAAAGGTISEMAQHGSNSFCCGGGGGRVLAEEKLGSRICEARAKMAAATGAPLLISNCPFCLTMFEDGIKGGGFEEQLAPRDLAELLVERLLAPAAMGRG